MGRQCFAAFLTAMTAILQVTAYTEPILKADKVFAQKQIELYDLFWHLDQPAVYSPELYKVAKSWNIADHVADYTDEVFTSNEFALLILFSKNV